MNESKNKMPFNDDPDFYRYDDKSRLEVVPVIHFNFKEISIPRAVALTRVIAQQLQDHEMLLKWFMELIGGFGLYEDDTVDGREYHMIRAHHCIEAIFNETDQGHKAMAEHLIKYGIAVTPENEGGKAQAAS